MNDGNYNENNNDNARIDRPSENPRSESNSPDETLRQLKSVQTLVTVAAVSGPVSIFIGGVLLAGIAVIAGILAFVKIRKLDQKPSEYAELIQKVKRSALIALAISVAAFALNVYALVTIMPMMLEAIESGDASSLLQDLYGGSSASSGSGSASGSSDAAQGSSVWG